MRVRDTVRENIYFEEGAFNYEFECGEWKMNFIEFNAIHSLLLQS